MKNMFNYLKSSKYKSRWQRLVETEDLFGFDLLILKCYILQMTFTLSNCYVLLSEMYHFIKCIGTKKYFNA